MGAAINAPSFFQDPQLPFNPTAPGQPGLSTTSPNIAPGSQDLDATLITIVSRIQQTALVVVKVAEEVARVINPIAGIGSQQRFIYLGYDAWSVLLTTMNPIGPMSATTYISPQTTTGSITPNDFQVILPPNFPTTIYYKNRPYTMSIQTNNFLIG